MRRNITAVLCTAQTVDKVTENTHKKNAENAIERSAENEARKNSETEKIFLILCLLKHYFVRLPCFCPLAVPLYSFGAKNTASRHLFRSLSALLPFYSLTVSIIPCARPAIPWISEGMIIFVALPSAAFSNASRLRIVRNA